MSSSKVRSLEASRWIAATLRLNFYNLKRQLDLWRKKFSVTSKNFFLQIFSFRNDKSVLFLNALNNKHCLPWTLHSRTDFCFESFFFFFFFLFSSFSFFSSFKNARSIVRERAIEKKIKDRSKNRKKA